MKALAATYSPYLVRKVLRSTLALVIWRVLLHHYTYQWSLAIATDLFAEFKKKGMRNTGGG